MSPGESDTCVCAPLRPPRDGSYVDDATTLCVRAPRGTLPPSNAKPLSVAAGLLPCRQRRDARASEA